MSPPIWICAICFRLVLHVIPNRTAKYAHGHQTMPLSRKPYNGKSMRKITFFRPSKCWSIINARARHHWTYFLNDVLTNASEFLAFTEAKKKIKIRSDTISSILLVTRKHLTRWHFLIDSRERSDWTNQDELCRHNESRHNTLKVTRSIVGR